MKKNSLCIFFKLINILLLLICVQGDDVGIDRYTDHDEIASSESDIQATEIKLNNKSLIIINKRSADAVQKIKIIKLSDIKSTINNVSDELLSNTEINKSNQNDSNVKHRQSSLVFVFDATGSMENDLTELRKGAKLILEAMINRLISPIYNYILVPYRDPEVGPMTVTIDSVVLLDALENMTLYGGGDCPEMSLSAITWAINASLPYSYVYVFTDASAKDYMLVGSILKLVQRKKSQVVFVLTGDCHDRDKLSYQVYHQIAVASSGQVFNLKKTEVSQVLKYVEDTLDTNSVNLGSSVNPSGYDYEQNVSIDETLKKVTVSVSGTSPQLSIKNPSGEIIDGPPKVVPTLSLSNIKIYNIINPEPGKWTITVGSSGEHSVKVSGISRIRFDYGFFINDTDKIHETTNRPLRDNENQLLIDIKEGNENIKSLDTLDILNSTGSFLFEVPLQKIKNHTNVYKTVPFLPPDGFFYFAINGLDIYGNVIRRVSSSAIESQWSEEPFISVEKEIFVPLHGNVTVKCAVESLVPAVAGWFRHKTPLQTKRNFAQSGIVEYDIIDVNENHDGIYVCRASNNAGKVSGQTNIIVTGSFPIVTLTPYNPEIETDTKFVMECLIESELQIMDVQIYSIDKRNNEKQILYPLNRDKLGTVERYSYEMSANFKIEGVYTCAATNKMGKTETHTNIKILPKLKIKIMPNIIEYQPGENVSVSCKIEGTKYGKWIKMNDVAESELCCNKYVSGLLSRDRDDVSLTLNIIESTKEDEGIYICTGYRQNIIYSETLHDDDRRNSVNANVTLIYVEQPRLLNNGDNEILIREGDDGILRCPSTGIPKPWTSWILPNGIELNSKIPQYGKFIFQNDNEIFINILNRTDEGDYICRVENQYGRVETFKKINVWKHLEFSNKIENKTVKIQDSIDLVCEIVGFPITNILWYFDDDIVVENLSNDNTTLSLDNVSLNNAGKYVCIAENKHEKIINEAYLNVIGTKPVVSLSPQNMTIRPGKDIFIECTVESDLPLISVEIIFENVSRSQMKLSTTNVVNDDVVRYYSHRLTTSQEIAGLYSCIATNLAGLTQVDVLLKIMPVMNVTVVPQVFEYEIGETISFSCNVNGSKTGSWEIPNFDQQTKEEYLIESTDDAEWVNLTIFIENATKLNEGEYICTGYRGEFDDKEIVNSIAESKIVEKPKIHGMDSKVSMEINQTIILDCNATGIPLPTINWILPNGVEIGMDNERININNKDQLLIRNINEDDEGKYTCVAKNHLGIDNEVIEISIWSKPFFNENMNNVTVNIYDDIDLICPIGGIPIPDIVWHHDDKELLSYNATGDNKTLILKNVGLNEGGKYSCFGQNLHGSVTGDIYLEITGLVPPTLMKNDDSFIIREDDRIEVVCRILEGKPFPKIYWQKDGMNISNTILFDAVDNVNIYDDDGIHKIVIEKVLRKNDGNYTCVGYNSIGIDKYEFYLDVYTAPRFTNIYQVVSHVDVKLNDEAIETTAGDSVVLKCESMGKPKPLISWSKDDIPLSYSNVIYTENNNSLIISKTQEIDAGAYTCHAQNSIGLSKKKITLIILVKPIMPNITFDPVLQKIEGQMVILPCPVYGIPPPEVKWQIGNNSIVPSDHMQVDVNNTLRFVANLTDSGVYECNAINKVGNTSQDYLLLVFMPPSIHPKDNEVVQISPGSSTTLECHTVGFPEPIIRWDKDGNIIEKNPSDINMTNYGRLDITNATQNDSGYYTCNAENNAGLSQKMFQIIINEPPIILEGDVSKTIELLKGKEEFNLPCQANGNPQPDIMWLWNGNIIVNDFHSHVKTDGTLSLKFLTENLSGIYTCRATNSEGTISVDYDLKIITPPTLIGEHDRNIIVIEGSDTVLECPIKPLLTPPKIEWYKDSELMIVNKSEMKLLLNNVSRHDVKKYSCLASNAMGSVLAKFNIIVHWAPTLIDKDSNETIVHLFEGDVMTLMCDVDANPEADIQWMKDLDLIGETSSVFERKDIKMHHAGDHICIASNPLGHVKKNFKINVSALPTIDGPDFENIEVKVGREATLLCNAHGIPKPDIKWNVIYAMDWTAVGNGDVLKSFNVSKKSEGIYVCEATNNVGSITKQFNLTVLELPQITHVQMIDDNNNTYNQTKDIFVKEASTINISCYSIGNPSPFVQWIRNGIFYNETLIDESHLMLSNVSKKDGGRYTCISSNKIGSDEYDIHIEVLALPNFIHDSNENDTKKIKVRENQHVTLNCQVDGNPPPDIYWFKDKRYMGFYDSIMTTKEHGQLLLINKISTEHAGKYMCVARNKVGESNKNFQIDVITPPIGERVNNANPSLVAKRGQDLYLECPVSGNPKPTIRWLKDPFFEILKNQHTDIQYGKTSSTLVINNSTIFDSGNYSCILTNEVGMAETSYSVEILEPPTIVYAQNKLHKVVDDGIITVKYRRGLELHCNATGYPEPKISWYKDGKLIDDVQRESIHLSLDRHYFNIMDVLVTDAGTYTCNAENIAGSVKREFKVKVLVPAEWGLWSPWSACSVSCGIGYHKRIRKCQFYVNQDSVESYHRTTSDKNIDNLKLPLLDESSCDGNNTEMRQCMIRPCKIDGGWSDWNDWTSCSVKCGQGFKQRVRNCTNPLPRYGGKLCEGLSIEQLACNGTECSSWYPWTEWSACSTTCGSGTQIRQRQCRGPIDTCSGNFRETMICNVVQCEVDGGWSEWGPWGSCSASCGTSQQSRTRQCNSPTPKSGGKKCKGGNRQVRGCIGIPSCDKIDHPSYNKYSIINPDAKKAHFSIKGKLNGNSIKPRFADVDVDEKDGRQYATTSLQQLVPVKDNYLPYVTFALNPDVDKSEQPNKRLFPIINNRSTQIEFATGEKFTMIQRREHLSKSGEYDYEIIINGTIPDERSVKKNKTNEGIFKNDGCSIGFGYNPKSGVCEDVDECKFSNTECHNTQMCENTIGSYKCLCETGYISFGTGKRCLDINECTQNIHGCSHECVNTPGSYYCNCPSNRRLSHDIKTCEEVTNVNNDKAVIIIDQVPDEKNDFDYDGENVLLTRISPKRDESEKSNYRRTRPHKHHLDYDYDYNAYLNDSIRSHDDYQEYNENESNAKINVTTKTSNPTNDCPLGFLKNREKCEDVDECEMNMNSCNDTINACINTLGSYVCVPTPCPVFYRRISNSLCVQKCDTTTCSQSAILQQNLRYITLSISIKAISIPGTIFNLDYGGTVDKTKYTLKSKTYDNIYEIVTEDSKGIILINKVPTLKHLHRIIVESHTYDERGISLLYYNKFVIYIYLLE